MEENQHDEMEITSQFSNFAICKAPLATAERHGTTTLFDLPDELILEILTSLPWREIVYSRCVCRWLLDKVDRSVKLQYQIQLGLSAMEDGPDGGPLSTAERLRLLLVKQNAWRNLAWRKVLTIPTGFSASSLCSIAQGALLLTPTTDPKSLYYIRLPLAEGPEIGVSLKWSQIEVEFEITDFTRDVEQDLLVLIEKLGRQIRFHFLTLSTEVPHPAASSPIFEHPSDVWWMDRSLARVAGSHLIVLFRYPGYSESDRLLVYSWRTGHKRAYVEAPYRVKLTSFALLSPYAFILASAATFDIYSFDPQSTVDPTPILNPLVTFSFPPRWVTYLHLVCHSNPYPRDHFSHLRSTTIDLPFHADHEDGIVVFWANLGLDYHLSFVVHRRTLLRYLEGWDGSQGVKIVNWEDWGPRNTRWFEDQHSEMVFRNVFGHRLVRLEPATDGTANKSIVVLDFNPAAISNAIARSVPSDLVTTCTTLGRGRWFKKDVESELPYLETRRTAPFDCSSVTLDDQRIILEREVNGNFEDFTLMLL